MTKLKLTYFDFDGGRGEPIRLALRIGGIAFEDHRIGMQDWPAYRDKTPFRAMPVLEADGKSITQSNTIQRYVGKLAGLYPKDDWQAALCDEVMDVTEDVGARIGATMAMGAEEKKKAREALAAGAITRYLEQMAARLQAGGGEWFVEKRLTVADLQVFGFIRWLRSGTLDHVPRDLVDRVAPTLVKHNERVAAQPTVAAYYASRKKG